MSYNSIEPAARTKNMTHAALPRSEAFHLRLEVQARARNERQRGTIGLRVRHLSLSYLRCAIGRRRGAGRRARGAIPYSWAALTRHHGPRRRLREHAFLLAAVAARAGGEEAITAARGGTLMRRCVCARPLLYYYFYIWSGRARPHPRPSRMSIALNNMWFRMIEEWALKPSPARRSSEPVRGSATACDPGIANGRCLMFSLRLIRLQLKIHRSIYRCSGFEPSTWRSRRHVGSRATIQCSLRCVHPTARNAVRLRRHERRARRRATRRPVFMMSAITPPAAAARRRMESFLFIHCTT
ncbi:hypothetical protein EVAR_43237_1 [Eumeta japonica]|uniref:Uncharacterized protein n=1 Tax=Eumeta variegata TaxID=151549 RepID=A0A4C1WUB8_EUMVA|nr:hypothetical protein EVAR_43237_1 [Eumeta japonica]